jgi:hypothetical protein
VALDSDTAGQNGYNRIVERYGGLFNIRKVILPRKDIGDMSIQEVKEVICPQL